MASKEKDEQTKGTPKTTQEDAVETNVTPADTIPRTPETAEASQSETPVTLSNGVTYLERTWREVPMFQCPECAYNNTELEDFARHQALVCRRPECPIPAPTMTAGPARQPVVLDRFGNPVAGAREERG